MQAIARLLRSTAFRLSLVYLVVFAIFAAFLITYISWNTRVLMAQQLSDTIDAEVTGLAEQYNLGGIRNLVAIVEDRSRRPSNTLYLVTSFAGQTLAGNVVALEPDVLSKPQTVRTDYRALDDDQVHSALVRVFVLAGGFRLMVGRDLEERQRFQDVVSQSTRIGLVLMLVLGVGGGYYVSRRVLARIDAMSASSRKIMEGRLSDRLPVSGSGDEIDRLAESLNDMLDRIGDLMDGIRGVSDNLAHDLKTPLTRLRNQVEAVLRGPASEAAYQEALEGSIEATDRILATFNALLMITRVEAGADSAEKERLAVGEVVRDVAELYEPAAEDAGVTLAVDVVGDPIVVGSRELLGQAVANLVDNALKYGASDAIGASRVLISARDVGSQVEIAVSDTGAGIPEDQRDKAIQRLQRLDESRSQPGSGLGLSLVAAIARLHKGELVLDDNRPGLRAVLLVPGDQENRQGD